VSFYKRAAAQGSEYGKVKAKEFDFSSSINNFAA
jgi:hypothetical protein